MTRLVGAALVAAGCFWLGEQKARRLRLRVRTLEGISGALEQMERELRLRLPPLPVLMAQVSGQCDPVAASLFQGCAGALEQLREYSLSAVWPQLLEELSALEEEDRRILAPLGHILGRYGGGEQADSIAQVRNVLEKRREQAMADSLRLGRVYRAVGAAGGGFLIILLL